MTLSVEPIPPLLHLSNKFRDGLVTRNLREVGLTVRELDIGLRRPPRRRQHIDPARRDLSCEPEREHDRHLARLPSP